MGLAYQALIEAGHDVDVVVPPPHCPSGKLLSRHSNDRSWSTGVGRQGERIRRTTFIPHGSGLLGRIVDEVVVMVSGLVDRGSDRGDGVALPDLRDRARRWGVGPTKAKASR